MNHAQIAKEALNMRLATLSSNVANDPLLDTRTAGELLAACGDPDVDKAIRNLGDTWQKAGLPVESIEKPWTEKQINDLISVGGDKLLDTLDELVNGITRCKIH
ncbi:MAG: hypothetical protein VX476_06055 [Actinomycetota bacterium]|mgnify:FL=1|nr:hypothetical protein [Actinomycetota bacterium]